VTPSPVEDVLTSILIEEYTSTSCRTLSSPLASVLSRLEHFHSTAVYTNMLYVPLVLVASLVVSMALAMPAVPDLTLDLAKRGFPSGGTTCYVSGQDAREDDEFGSFCSGAVRP
jgi:hypothetical protein